MGSLWTSGHAVILAVVHWHPEQMLYQPIDNAVVLLSVSSTHAHAQRRKQDTHTLFTYSPWNKKETLVRKLAVCLFAIGYTVGALDKACKGTYGPHERNTCLFKLENKTKSCPTANLEALEGKLTVMK